MCPVCGSGQQCATGTCQWLTRSFANDVWPIFMTNGCTGNMCHGAIVPQSGLDMRTRQNAYATLVNALSEQCTTTLRVAPGSPSTSYLINKLTGVGMCQGTRMPKMGTPLTAAQMDTIRAWIGAGAPNN